MSTAIAADQPYPFVSILVAARNEEHTILRCLASLERLSYPRDRLEIWIGNDHSEDWTGVIVSAFIKNKPQFHLLNVTTSIGQARGKANVLAQLAQQASGDYLLFTDADISVSPGWVETMICAVKPGTGIVTGFTVIEGRRLFDHLQSIDWIGGQSLVHVAGYFNIPLTSMGNNMMVDRKAYLDAGGYENLPFSVVEDFTLFHRIVEKGWGFANCCHPNLVTASLPMPDLRSLLQQRRRWMKGVMALPPHLLLPILLHVLFLPLLLVTAFFNPLLAAGLWVVKFLLNGVLYSVFIVKSRQFHLLPLLPLYEVCNGLFLPVQLVLHLAGPTVVWKGRKYDQ